MMLSSMPLVAGKNDIAQNYIPFLLWLTRLWGCCHQIHWQHASHKTPDKLSHGIF
jgi:hypothetical protein